MRLLHKITVTLCVASLATGCGLFPQEGHTPVPRQSPVSKQESVKERTHFMESLAYAQLALDVREEKDAARYLQKAQKSGLSFSPNSNQSSLYTELHYVSNGAVSKVYVPQLKGVGRFETTRAFIVELKDAGIHPTEYRLVQWHNKGAVGEMRTAIGKAYAEVDVQKVSDKKGAAIRAARELRDSFARLNPKPYAGTEKNQAFFHTDIAELFVQQRLFDMARKALERAEKAQRLYKLQEPSDKEADVLGAKLSWLEKVIAQEDPSLLERMGEKIKRNLQ